jgi:hypothetical protein
MIRASEESAFPIPVASLNSIVPAHGHCGRAVLNWTDAFRGEDPQWRPSTVPWHGRAHGRRGQQLSRAIEARPGVCGIVPRVPIHGEPAP